MITQAERVDVLSGEIQLALQIEGNDPASGWAVELRRSLQRKNDDIAELIEASTRLYHATTYPVLDGQDDGRVKAKSARVAAALARIGGDV